MSSTGKEKSLWKYRSYCEYESRFVFKNDTSYDTFTIRQQTKTKPKPKPKPKIVVVVSNRRIFNRRIFNRRI